MATITTTSDMVAPILTSLAPGMLDVPTPDFNYPLGADKYAVPWKGGTTLRFIRPRLLQPPIIPLGNSGIEPAPQLAQRDFVDADMQFYGTSVIINEQVVLQNQDGALAWVSERLAVAMRQAEDLILRQFLLSTPNQYNCQNGANGDIPTELTFADFSQISALLSTQNAQKFMAGMRGEDRIGTSPVRQGYLMFASTDLQTSLDPIPEFTNPFNYPNPNNAEYGEFGACLNVRAFTSSQAATAPGASANGRTVFENITTGRQGYAHIDQDGYGMELLFRPREFSGPLGLNYTLGIKFAQAQALTQSTWVLNVRSTGRF